MHTVSIFIYVHTHISRLSLYNSEYIHIRICPCILTHMYVCRHTYLSTYMNESCLSTALSDSSKGRTDRLQTMLTPAPAPAPLCPAVTDTSAAMLCSGWSWLWDVRTAGIRSFKFKLSFEGSWPSHSGDWVELVQPNKTPRCSPAVYP